MQAPNPLPLATLPHFLLSIALSLASGGDSTLRVLVWCGSWRRQNHAEAEPRMEESGGLSALRQTAQGQGRGTGPTLPQAGGRAVWSCISLNAGSWLP